MLKYVAAVIIWAVTLWAQAEVVEIRPLRTSSLGGILGELDGHLRPGHPYMDNDRTTASHEMLHGINSRIRMELKTPNAYYLFDNTAFIIGKSPIKLNQLANRIPQNMRGGSYNLYLVQQQQYWNDDAMYIVEELTCYVGGSYGGLTLDLEFRSLDSFRRALEMRQYVGVLQEMCREANWSEQQEMDELILGIDRAIYYLDAEYKKKGWEWRR